MGYFNKFENAEKEIQLETEKNYPENIRLFQEGIDLVDETIDSICKKADEVHFTGLEKYHAFLVFPRLLMTQKAIINLILSGYYVEALTLSRSWLECFGILSLLLKKDEKAYDWLKGKEIKPSIEIFYAISKKDELINKNLTGKAYGFLCNVVHNNFNVMKLWSKPILEEKPKLEFQTLPEYRNFEAKHLLISFLPTLLLMQFTQYYGEEIDNDIKNKINLHLKSIIQKIENFNQNEENI